jgi:glutamate/aspartate transport system substrate-binding protein
VSILTVLLSPDSKLPTGYAVDICLKFVDAIKKELKAPNLKVHYLLVTPSSRIPAIIEGKADMECGSTTNNAERRKQVSFTIPISLHRRACWCADAGIKNWIDLKDKKS